MWKWNFFKSKPAPPQERSIVLRGMNGGTPLILGHHHDDRGSAQCEALQQRDASSGDDDVGRAQVVEQSGGGANRNDVGGSGIIREGSQHEGDFDPKVEPRQIAGDGRAGVSGGRRPSRHEDTARLFIDRSNAVVTERRVDQGIARPGEDPTGRPVDTRVGAG